MSAQLSPKPHPAAQRLRSGEAPHHRALSGLVVAGATAVISGISVFVNSYGVHAISQPSVYTTAKNLVATVVLAAAVFAAGMLAQRRTDSGFARYVRQPVTATYRSGGGGRSKVPTTLRWLGLAYVGLVGGGMAFVIFFDGLADTTATAAAFMHDTLVIWVALLALPILHERLKWWNIAAIGLLVFGEVAIVGGFGHLSAHRGQALVLVATLLWAIEVVVAKLLLRDLSASRLAVVRMGVGSFALVLYLLATGELGVLGSLDARQMGWALLTGLLLAAYVGTWMTALQRARAVDVTSILVASALITALLQAAAGTASLAPQAVGLVMVLAGTGVVVWAGTRHAERRAQDVRS